MKSLLLSLWILLNLSASAIPDEKKLILVYIEMEFCPWCHKMDKETLEDKASLKRLNKEYLIARITLESGDVPLFLKPKYYPTTYILSSDGSKVLDELPGYMKNKLYLEYLETLYAVENEPSD